MVTQHRMKIPNKTKVTVGLICHREKEKLALTLNSLVKQTAFQNIGEVLLLQNGTCEKTLNCAKVFSKKLPLTIFSQPENHIGKGRAVITNQAVFSLIAWTDGDCLLPPDWLEKLLANWESCRILSPAGVGGPNRLPEKKLWQKLVNLSLSHPLGHGWSPQAWSPQKKVSVSHLPTANALFSVSKIKKVGNFSLKCHPIGEDLHLGLRLKKLSSLYLFPAPVVINNHSSSFSQSLQRLFRFGEIRHINKDLLLIPSLLFVPGFILFLILGFYHFIFWLPLIFYFILLLQAALQILKNNQTALAFLLPFIWPAQHFAYSFGTILGLIKNREFSS